VLSETQLLAQIQHAASQWPEDEHRELVNVLIDLIEKYRPKDRDRDE
jgi:hypothetical protein